MVNPVVVVGGGVVGTSVAYHLRDADREVILLEKDSLGSGTTGDSIAMFTYHQEPPEPTETDLRQRAWSFYDDLVADGTLTYERIGTLHTAKTEAGMAEVREIAAGLDEMGVRTELLDAEDVAEFGVTADAVRGAVHLPDEGYLDPTQILQHFVGEGAARLETETAVTDVHLDDGVTAVETTEGTVPADAVVNAAGPWAGRLNDLVGVSLPMRHTYGPILVLQATQPLSLPFTLFEGGYYAREEGTRQAFVGRFSAAWEDAPTLDPDASHAVDQEFYLAAEELLAEAVPALTDADVVTDWMGVRTVTPDGRPYAGETSVPGYYVACGLSGFGITRAPVVGEVLAAQVLADLGEDGEILDPADGRRDGGDPTPERRRYREHMSPSRV